MGNSYELFKQGNKVLDIDEMSCNFQLTLDDPDNEVIVQLNNLTPEQLGEIAVKMIHAASYFVEDARAFMDKYAFLARKY